MTNTQNHNLVNKKWKPIAIIFIILFTLETLFVGWGVILAIEEEEKNYECLYDICDDYPQAYYDDPICYCYDYDVLGQLIVVDEEYMG